MSEENKDLARLRNLLDRYYDTRHKVRLKCESSLLNAGVSVPHKPHPFTASEMFKFLVRKKMLLSQLELLFCSYELNDDPKWSIDRLKSILESIESLRRAVSADHANCSSISLVDICDTFVLTNGYVTSETVVEEVDLTIVNKWVEIDWNITVGVVVLLLCNTMLLSQCYTKRQCLVPQVERWCDLDIGLLEDRPDLKKLVGVLWGRVWQEVGRRLVPRILEMKGRVMKEETMNRIFQLWKGFDKFPPVCHCLRHMIDSIKIRDEMFNCYTESTRRSLVLSAKSTPLAVRDGASDMMTVLQKRLMFFKQERHIHLFQDTTKAQAAVKLERGVHVHVSSTHKSRHVEVETYSRDSDVKRSVAMESNAMLTSYPLIPAVNCALWSVHRWTIHRLQRCLSTDDLSDIVQLVFEVSMNLRERQRELVSECGVAAAPSLHLPKDSPQYWITRWNREAYARLHEGNVQSEHIINGLCEAFLIQWRGKCRHLLDVVFPSTNAWKKADKLKVSTAHSHSTYLTLVREQLVLPLLCACGPLSSSTQPLCVYLAFSALMLELWTVILKRTRTPSLSMSKQLQTDCQHLVSLFTDQTNSLQQRSKEVVALAPILRGVGRRLLQEEQCMLEEDEATMVKEVHKRIQEMCPFKMFLSELGWLDL